MSGYAAHLAAAKAVGLDIYGAFHAEPGDDLPKGCATLLMLGPHEPGFWARFQASAEYRDGAAHPMDRWSTRVVGDLARDLEAVALLPFGGPPYQPFIRWAMRSGRAWQSPAGPLVHDRAGMLVSYRGALAVRARLDLPQLPANPCDSCAEQPCLTTCPVGALGPQGYDVAACHGFLDQPAGGDCMARGCAARRSCPVSQSYQRAEAQSAFHMKAFHP